MGAKLKTIQRLELPNAIKTVITVFHNVKENTPEMSKRQEFFPEKWKLLYKKKKKERTLEQENEVFEIGKSLTGSMTEQKWQRN